MMKETIRILFVCTGNICRSPLAEAVLRGELERRGAGGQFVVDSAGTHADHLGQQSDRRMRAVASRHGVAINHTARRIRPDDLVQSDHIFAMDSGHYRALTRLAQDGDAERKVVMFRVYDPELRDHFTGKSVTAVQIPDVPDPWYGSGADFELVYEMVHRTCIRILEVLLSGPND